MGTWGRRSCPPFSIAPPVMVKIETHDPMMRLHRHLQDPSLTCVFAPGPHSSCQQLPPGQT